MHRLSCIEIKNFRACREVFLPLESYTPLVGQNNAGKSTILEAIRWVLKPTALTMDDFLNDSESVTVTACIEGVTEEMLGSIHDLRHRRAIEPYCVGGKLWVRVMACSAGAKPVQEVWDVSACNEDEVPKSWRAYPTGLPQAVSVLLPEPIYIEALDDIGEDLGKAKSGTTIKGLLDEIMAPLLETHRELNSALDTVRNILTVNGSNRSDHLLEFDQRASKALMNIFPGLSLSLDLQVVDIKEFFKAGDLNVTDGTTGDCRRFNQMGSGAQRAVQMALVRYLAELRTKGRATFSRRLLLIDEPELYLHPQGVRQLRQALSNLATGNFQVIFSTHSPLMLSRENAADTVIVNKTAAAGVSTQKPLRKAVRDAIGNAESQTRTLFELGNLADIYFADRVILCEGKTDRRLLPLAYERLYQNAPDLDQIVFVSLGSCADIPKALPVLSAMGIKAYAVADLDFAFTHARSGGMLDKDGKDLLAVKAELLRLQKEHSFTLETNGLPKNDKGGGFMAAEVWALMAADSKGQVIARSVHDSLRQKGVWIWSQGCIEQVIGADRKGEDAIIEQEKRFCEMTAQQFEQEMPAFKECFDWIRSI